MNKAAKSVLAMFLACGCGTDIHVKSARVETFGRDTFVVTIVVDEDLDSEKWAPATPSFRFVVLDEGRLTAIRKSLPDTPEYVERAGPQLEEDWREQFIVMGWIEAEWPLDRVATDGGLRHGVPVAPGKWAYRIEIPYTLSLDPNDLDEEVVGESRETYQMLPGREYQLWGRVVGIEYMLCPWYESDRVRLSVHRPR